jgi:hypothetical protein
LESLEDRFLLYATTGDLWSKPIRITLSLMPDGTSIGGVPSNLQQTLNKRFATADWQAQILDAAASWEKAANLNVSLVTDDGSPVGVSGDQQDDPRFGDIRIGGFAMSSKTLAFAYLPPPSNGGTDAGDIFFNTSISWQINGKTYDLRTVALHELGHALGMGHSAISTAVMWPSYTGSKQALTTDDISGIRTIYGAHQPDSFDATAPNNTASTATDLSSYIGTNGQVTLPSLDITAPLTIGSPDVDWYNLTIPATTTGTMVVQMQSAGLSLLSPSLAVFNSTGTTILGQQSSSNLGDTVTVTLQSVSPSQVYKIRCQGSTTADWGFGAYGLQVNLGSYSLSPIPPPNTIVAQAPDQSGGTITDDRHKITVGTLSGIGDNFVVDDNSSRAPRGEGERLVAPLHRRQEHPLRERLGTRLLPLPAGAVRRAGERGRGPSRHEGAARASLNPRGSGGVAPEIPWWQSPHSITVSPPAWATDPVNQNVPAVLDFFSSDSNSDTSLLSLSHSKNRRPQRMRDAAADRALDGWRSDLLN